MLHREAIRGSCEDHRAAATVDRALDTADLHRRVEVKLLVLWGVRSNVAKLFSDLLAIWGEYAAAVRGRAVESGHYVNEEAPEAVLTAFADFFGGSGPARPRRPVDTC